MKKTEEGVREGRGKTEKRKRQKSKKMADTKNGRDAGTVKGREEEAEAIQ